VQPRQFTSQKALLDYAEQNGLVYVWVHLERQRAVSPAFIERQQLLSPDQYEIVEVRTSRGLRQALLFPKAILQAEFAANAPIREVLATKRERLRAQRAAAKQRSTRAQANSQTGTASKSASVRSLNLLASWLYHLFFRHERPCPSSERVAEGPRRMRSPARR
jgi:hypothetical protein